MKDPASGPPAPLPGKGVPEELDDAGLIEAISRGSVSAFIELFDRTSPAVRAAVTALPIDDGRREDVLAASYLEVWWLAGCHTDPFDIVEWIVGIARRRLADACLGPDSPTEPVKTGSPVPGYASQELAAMLHRTVDIPEPG